MKKIQIPLTVIFYTQQSYLSIQQFLLSIEEVYPQLPFKVIIIYNGADLRYSRQIKQRFPYTKLRCYKQIISFSDAINTELKTIPTRYLLVLNSVTIINKETIQQLVSFITKQHDCALVTCQINDYGTHIMPSFITHRASIRYPHLINRPHSKSDSINTYMEVDSITSYCLLIRTSILKTTGFLTEHCFQFRAEADFSQRVKAGGWKLYHLTTVGMVHTLLEELKDNQDIEIYTSHIKFAHLHQIQRMIHYLSLYKQSHAVMFLPKILKSIFMALYYRLNISITSGKQQITQPIRYLRDTIDKRHLLRALPDWSQLESLQGQNRVRLAPYYSNYIQTVSVEPLIISLDLAALVLAICQIMRPQKIADLGSGFSSLVFGLYQRHTNPSAVVYSIDTSKYWLSKTRKFLERNTFYTNKFLLWNTFKFQSNANFDFIFNDLGMVDEVRRQTIIPLFKRCRPGGIIILDDTNIFRNSAHDLSQLSQSMRRQFLSLGGYIHDPFQRETKIVI